ncbi:MAG: hypothetical protein WCC73_10720 [Terracidiphilus sp.]
MVVEEQNRVRKVYPRRSPAEVAQLVAEYESSGLKPSAFCRLKGMNRLTLETYRLRQKAASQAAVGERWLEVEVAGSRSGQGGGGESGLTVVLPGGCRIEISRRFDADTLKRLLDVVERG